jgi:hypothetical protein
MMNGFRGTTHTHSLTETYTHSPFRHSHTLVIVLSSTWLVSRFTSGRIKLITSIPSFVKVWDGQGLNDVEWVHTNREASCYIINMHDTYILCIYYIYYIHYIYNIYYIGPIIDPSGPKISSSEHRLLSIMHHLAKSPRRGASPSCHPPRRKPSDRSRDVN